MVWRRRKDILGDMFASACLSRIPQAVCIISPAMVCPPVLRRLCIIQPAYTPPYTLLLQRSISLHQAGQDKRAYKNSVIPGYICPCIDAAGRRPCPCDGDRRCSVPFNCIRLRAWSGRAVIIYALHSLGDNLFRCRAVTPFRRRRNFCHPPGILCKPASPDIHIPIIRLRSGFKDSIHQEGSHKRPAPRHVHLGGNIHRRRHGQKGKNKPVSLECIRLAYYREEKTRTTSPDPSRQD